MSSARAAYSGLLTGLDVTALLTLAILGLIHLPYNFFSDQALFAVGARMMSEGAVLYRDFLDIKQPGIYAFYWLGGQTFGFNEIGIHAFELIYMLAFACFLIFTLRHYFRHRWAASLAPIVTVGAYYAIARDVHLTQIEALVGFPLFVACWAAAKASTDQSTPRYFFLSGLAGGIVLFFKIALAPILAGFWLLALAWRVWPCQFRFRRATGAMIAIAGGLAIPVLLTFGYFYHEHALGPFLYATFALPTHALKVIAKPGIGRLFDSAQWFVQSLAPALTLAFVGALGSLRSKKDPLTLCLVIWVLMGCAAIVIQRLSWWEYHFMLLFVPVGILATRGIEEVWRHIRSLEGHVHPSSLIQSKNLTRFAIASLFLPMVVDITGKALTLARYRFASTATEMRGYQTSTDPRYAEWQSAADFPKQPDARSIYIFGEPVLYYLAGKEPSLRVPTPDGGIMTPEMWAALTRDLERKRPVYVYIQDSSPEYEVQAHSTQTWVVIQNMYHAVHSDRMGTWYKLNDAGA